MKCNFSDLVVNNQRIEGNSNTIKGSNNVIIGHFNKIYGNGNSTEGNSNYLEGTNLKIDGNFNKYKGSCDLCMGNSNSCIGTIDLPQTSNFETDILGIIKQYTNSNNQQDAMRQFLQTSNTGSTGPTGYTEPTGYYGSTSNSQTTHLENRNMYNSIQQPYRPLNSIQTDIQQNHTVLSQPDRIDFSPVEVTTANGSSCTIPGVYIGTAIMNNHNVGKGFIDGRKLKPNLKIMKVHFNKDNVLFINNVEIDEDNEDQYFDIKKKVTKESNIDILLRLSKKVCEGEPTCNICMEYKKNCIINCSHTFCGKCILEVVEKGNKKCPNCVDDITEVKEMFL